MHNRMLIALLAVGLVATACAAGTTSTATPRPQATGTPAAPATGTPAAAGTTVELATNALGEIVVDGAGMTLYGFTPDEPTTQPTCYDQCAAAWPPLTVEGAFTVGAGLDMADFSTATRTDGSTQLKLGIYPLYYFAGDEAPGDTNGQGLQDVWFVIGADGELIRD